MATQQLLFDILARSQGVDKTFQDVVDSAETMAGKLGAVGAKATSSLFSPTAAGLAGGIAGAAVIQGLTTAIDMDGVTRKMSAGLALTAPESEKAGSVAGRLYSDAYGESFGEVTAAVGATMSSISGLRGASEGEIEALTGSVMDLSSAFEIDVPRTAQVAGQMITTGLAKNGTEAVDLLAATLAKVPVNVREDVLDAIDEYGPMFANLGFSGGEAMTMLADASAKGMYGIDKTGDALKEFTIRATDMSKATAGAYEALGMDQTDMTNRLLAGGDTARAAFDEIIMGLGSIQDPAMQSQAALALFGTPIEDLGTAEIPKFIDSLLNSQEALGTVEGSAAKLGDTINGGPGAAFTTFQRTIETALGELGSKMLPILTPILQGLIQFAPAIIPVVIALGAMAGAITLVNIAMMPHALLVGGIVLAVMALIAAIVFLVANWDSVVAFLGDVWNGFVGWFQGVMAGFVGWWNDVWAGFGGWVTDVWNGFVGFIGDIWNGFMGWIQGVVGGFVGWWNGIWTAVGDFIAGVWAGISAAAAVGFQMFVQPIIDGITGLWNFIVSIFTGIGDFIVGAWTWIANLAVAIFQAFLQEHGDELSAFWNVIVGIFTAIGSFIAGIWNGIVSAVSGAVAAVWAVVTTIFTAVWSFLSGVFAAIVATIAGAWNWVVGIVSGAVSAVWGVVTSIFTAVWSFISAVFSAIGGFIGQVWATIVGVISGAVSAVWGAISSGIGAAWNFIVGAFSAVAGFLGGIWNGIVSGVSGMIGNVVGYLGGLGGQIMGALAGAGSWLYNAGRNIVEGLLNGLKSLAGTVGNFFLGLLPGWIVEPFKAALGIHSPSTVFAVFGENIGEGVLVGVGRMQGRIDDRMAALVTVPDAGVTGAGSFGGGGTSYRAGGSSLDDLIDAIRSQRPVQVIGAPGQDEETLARATAEQLLWRG